MNRQFLYSLICVPALCGLPSTAFAENYATLSNAAFAGNLMSGATEVENGRTNGLVQMYPAVSVEEQLASSFGQHWYTEEGSGENFRIKIKGAKTAACLTLVAHSDLGVIAELAPCAEDGAQWWSGSDEEPMRIYNDAFQNGECLTAINSGEYNGWLTMTECGTGDVATELWTGIDVPN